jgi:hypothetical protein
MDKIEFEKYKPEKRPGPNSPRAYWVDKTAVLLGKPFKQILGITRDWPVEWIQSMYQLCVDAPNPGRLWFGLRKKRKHEAEISNKNNR